jgi:hypothetical protein
MDGILVDFSYLRRRYLYSRWVVKILPSLPYENFYVSVGKLLTVGQKTTAENAAQNFARYFYYCCYISHVFLDIVVLLSHLFHLKV